MITQLNPQQALSLLAADALLVDVREVSEVAELAYDVTKQVNIPLSEFEKRFTEIPKTTEIILACRSGVRSHNAAEFLLSQGYEKIYNLEDGILAWSKGGFPTK